MPKVRKILEPVKSVNKNSKVKKLLNNPGVQKSSVKINLKNARVPLMQILKNKSEADKNVNLIEDSKILKRKKNVSKPAKKSVESNEDVKVERVPIMKTLKRSSSSEKIVRPPRLKRKLVSSDDPIEKATKKVPQQLQHPVKLKVEKKDTTVVDKKVLKKNKKQQPNEERCTTIDEAQVAKGISAVLKLSKLQDESKKKLFDEEHQPIFLQVSCIKIPKVARRQLRIMLPHTLVTDTDDVVLFVGDLKKGRRQDFEPTIHHYQDLLREHGCTQIKDVIPLTQVKTEYDQYELKRKLLSSYDYFLTDGKIAGHLFHLLGKIFIDRRKAPTSIRMTSKNLKHEINDALRKTIMTLHGRGNSHILQVAHTAMQESQILENILSACKTVARTYPGGWDNIRSLILKTSSSLAVPIYVTLKNRNNVKVPVVKSKRPKAYHPVSGDLSTVTSDNVVVVQPSGKVTLIKKDDTKGRKKTAKVQRSKNLKKVKTDELSAAPLNVNAEDSENELTTNMTNSLEDSEDEIEEAEQAYLSQWQEENITESTEEKKPTKKTKIVSKKKKKA